MRLFLIVCSLFTIGIAAEAQERGWICNYDASAGIKYFAETDEWQAVIFDASDPILIGPANEASIYPDASFEVKVIGDKWATKQCEFGPDENGFMTCFGFGGSLRFNSKTLRFQDYYSVGYVISDLSVDQSGNTPSVSIGRCSPL